MAKRILVIDDEVDICTLLQRVLDMEGYSVAVCASQDEALDLFHGSPWDLVLLDVVMPGLCGWKLAEVLRERRPDVPRCFITARIDAAYEEALGEGLIQGYLYKPFAFADIENLIRHALAPRI